MDYIKEKLQEIFRKRFNTEIEEKSFSKELSLISDINLNYQDLLYFLKDVEETFGFETDSASIEAGRIRTLKGLVSVIEENLKKAALK